MSKYDSQVRLATHTTGEYHASISMQTIADPRLTPTAKMIGIYMIARAGIPGWRFFVSEIASNFLMGHSGTAVRNAINELIETDYLERVQVRDDAGRVVGYDYTVHPVSPSAPPSRDCEERRAVIAARVIPRSKVAGSAPSKTEEAPRRAAPKTQPEHDLPEPVTAQEAPAQKATGKPKRTAAEARQARQDMHHRVLEAWNGMRGAMPEMDARPTDGRLIADKRLAMLIESLVRDKGGEQHALAILQDASKQWNAELDREPGGWLERNANIERVFMNASAAARAWRNAQRRSHNAPTDADAGAAQMPWM